MDMSTMTMVGSAIAVLVVAALVAVALMTTVRGVARGDGSAKAKSPRPASPDTKAVESAGTDDQTV